MSECICPPGKFDFACRVHSGQAPAQADGGRVQTCPPACDHVFDKEVEFGRGASLVCSRCGVSAMDVSLLEGP